MTHDERTQAVLEAIAMYGLHQLPDQLSQEELVQQRKFAQSIAAHNSTVPVKELVEAIRFGMKQVWPFTEQPIFDGSDVSRNFTKAKAAAAILRRQGQIPMTPEEAAANFDRQRSSDEQS